MRRVTGDRPVPGPVSRASDRLLLFEHHPPGRGDGRHLDSQRVRLVGGRLSPQLTAFFTSAALLPSSAAVNSISAKATGHMAPSSRFAASLKPSVAYLVWNFCALWKWQTTLLSLAYAGIPYQSLGERAGALALMIAWSRSPIARSGSGSSAILASTALSKSASSARRAAAFTSWTRSFIAPRSSSVNPLDVLPIAVVLLADFCVAFVPGFLSAIVADLLRAALSRSPDVTDRSPASYLSRSPRELCDRHASVNPNRAGSRSRSPHRIPRLTYSARL